MFPCSRKVLNDRDIVTGLKNTFPAAEARLVLTHKMPFFEQAPTGPILCPWYGWAEPQQGLDGLRFPPQVKDIMNTTILVGMHGAGAWRRLT